MSGPLPAELFFWTNGQVMAFDDRGRQLASWNGNAADIDARLNRLAQEDRAKIEIRRGVVWRHLPDSRG